jgi:hypothetical protein
MGGTNQRTAQHAVCSESGGALLAREYCGAKDDKKRVRQRNEPETRTSVHLPLHQSDIPQFSLEVACPLLESLNNLVGVTSIPPGKTLQHFEDGVVGFYYSVFPAKVSCHFDQKGCL